MIYPILIHKDPHSDYGVSVPDLPGCISAGRTLDEALAMAKEAIELHLEGLIDDGQVVPQPRTIEHHQSNPDFRLGTWALVTIDPSHLRVNAKRVNITIPQRILEAIDRAARDENETRSGLLTKAANVYIQKKRPKTKAKKPPGSFRR